MTDTGSVANFLNCLRNNILKGFTGSSPFVPQLLIGAGSVFIRPLLILNNKKEDREKAVGAAVRVAVTEGLATPIALLCGKIGETVGRKILAKNSLNKEGICAFTGTVGFALANLVVPSLTTISLHKLRLKEKIEAIALSQKPGQKTKNSFGSLNRKNEMPKIQAPKTIINKNLSQLYNKTFSGSLTI